MTRCDVILVFGLYSQLDLLTGDPRANGGGLGFFFRGCRGRRRAPAAQGRPLCEDSVVALSTSYDVSAAPLYSLRFLGCSSQEVRLMLLSNHHIAHMDSFIKKDEKYLVMFISNTNRKKFETFQTISVS